MGLVGVHPETTIAIKRELNNIFEGLKLIGTILMFVRKKNASWLAASHEYVFGKLLRSAIEPPGSVLQ